MSRLPIEVRQRLEGGAVAAQDRRERSSEGGLRQGVVLRLDDHLAADQGQTHGRSFLDAHDLGEVPRDQDTEAASNFRDTPVQGHP